MDYNTQHYNKVFLNFFFLHCCCQTARYKQDGVTAITLTTKDENQIYGSQNKNGKPNRARNCPPLSWAPNISPHIPWEINILTSARRAFGVQKTTSRWKQWITFLLNRHKKIKQWFFYLDSEHQRNTVYYQGEPYGDESHAWIIMSTFLSKYTDLFIPMAEENTYLYAHFRTPIHDVW